MNCVFLKGSQHTLRTLFSFEQSSQDGYSLEWRQAISCFNDMYERCYSRTNTRKNTVDTHVMDTRVTPHVNFAQKRVNNVLSYKLNDKVIRGSRWDVTNCLSVGDLDRMRELSRLRGSSPPSTAEPPVTRTGTTVVNSWWARGFAEVHQINFGICVIHDLLIYRTELRSDCCVCLFELKIVLFNYYQWYIVFVCHVVLCFLELCIICLFCVYSCF